MAGGPVQTADGARADGGRVVRVPGRRPAASSSTTSSETPGTSSIASRSSSNTAPAVTAVSNPRSSMVAADHVAAVPARRDVARQNAYHARQQPGSGRIVQAQHLALDRTHDDARVIRDAGDRVRPHAPPPGRPGGRRSALRCADTPRRRRARTPAPRSPRPARARPRRRARAPRRAPASARADRSRDPRAGRARASASGRARARGCGPRSGAGARPRAPARDASPTRAPAPRPRPRRGPPAARRSADSRAHVPPPARAPGTKSGYARALASPRARRSCSPGSASAIGASMPAATWLVPSPVRPSLEHDGSANPDVPPARRPRVRSRRRR